MEVGVLEVWNDIDTTESVSVVSNEECEDELGGAGVYW